MGDWVTLLFFETLQLSNARKLNYEPEVNRSPELGSMYLYDHLQQSIESLACLLSGLLDLDGD
jgi:hypothetical protein